VTGTQLRSPDDAALLPHLAPGNGAAGGALVELVAVTKAFGSGPGRTVAVADLDLRVMPGEFVCVLGASGCGKSTLLNLLAGLEAPSDGSLVLPEQGAALMFQEGALFPWLSVRRNVELSLRIRGIGRRERTAEARRLLDLVRLSDVGERRVHELSGGMRQRAALARALAQDTELLLMDEPFAALDAITRDLLHVELLRLWRQLSRTIVFVTHNVREAIALGERVLLLSSRPGRVIGEWHTAHLAGHTTEATELSTEITQRLREELRRHGA
jgi:NitT/TauT family transport system ATP-binding protein